MKVAIKTDYIKLDQLLKHAAVASTGGEAKALIKDGMVSLNGETATQRGKKIYPGDRLTVLDQEIEVVSA